MPEHTMVKWCRRGGETGARPGLLRETERGRGVCWSGIVFCRSGWKNSVASDRHPDQTLMPLRPNEHICVCECGLVL